MYGPLIRSLWAALLVVVGGSCATTHAQENGARLLAPGVLTVIPPAAEKLETVTGPVPIVELVSGMPDLQWTPHYDPISNTLHEMAKRVIYRRKIWCLEFAFKPLRMIEVDIPQANGKMQRKLVWYLAYHVRNDGYDLNPKGTPDRWGHEVFDVEDDVTIDPLRFFPHFVLGSVEFDKEYLDRLIPAAQRAIQDREKPGAGIRLFNSVEMTQQKIPLSDGRIDKSVWGVATWEDVDPRIDFFSVFVRGLTNAFRFEDPPGAYQVGAPPGSGRVFSFKTLQLNFWRPGDALMEHEREIRFGVPVDPDPTAQQEILNRFGLGERLDHLWVYR
ncbi:MAG: hypothetical protein ACC628_06400 [Pirellulaceae bacterium]